MRLFVALDLEPNILSALGESLDQFRRLSPDARWTRVEAMHLTLKFIGEVPPAREPEIVDVLSSIEAPRFKLAFRGTGVFGRPRQPKVFWAGVQDSPELRQLAQRVESRLAAIGIPEESRPFSPHLTLARSRTPGDLRAAAEHAGRPEWGEQQVEEFCLYQSHPTRGQYEYEKRHRFPLR